MKIFKFAQALVVCAIFSVGCQEGQDATAPDATPPAGTQEDVQADDTLGTDPADDAAVEDDATDPVE